MAEFYIERVLNPNANMDALLRQTEVFYPIESLMKENDMNDMIYLLKGNTLLGIKDGKVMSREDVEKLSPIEVVDFVEKSIEKAGISAILVGSEREESKRLSSVLGEKTSRWGVRELIAPNGYGGYSRFKVYSLNARKQEAEFSSYQNNADFKLLPQPDKSSQQQQPNLF